MSVASWVWDALASDLRALAARIGSPAGDALASAAASLARDPKGLAAALETAIGNADPLATFRDLVADPLGDIEAIMPTTKSRRLWASARTALEQAVRALASVEFAARTGVAAYTYREAAAAALAEASGVLDDAETSADAATFAALADLRAAMTSSIDERIRDLPELTSATPASILPATVLAYDLYGDLSREAEIVAANPVWRPLFMPAHPLQLLSR